MVWDRTSVTRHVLAAALPPGASSLPRAPHQRPGSPSSTASPHAPHGHPIAELICTVLSQSTNDRNRDVAYLRLRERFETWEAVRDAPVEEVEEAIRRAGSRR